MVPEPPGWRDQVHTALLGLGWAAKEADAAVDRVAPMVDDGLDPTDVPTLLKAALRTLATEARRYHWATRPHLPATRPSVADWSHQNSYDCKAA